MQKRRNYNQIIAEFLNSGKLYAEIVGISNLSTARASISAKLNLFGYAVHPQSRHSKLFLVNSRLEAEIKDRIVDKMKQINKLTEEIIVERNKLLR